MDVISQPNNLAIKQGSDLSFSTQNKDSLVKCHNLTPQPKNIISKQNVSQSPNQIALLTPNSNTDRNSNGKRSGNFILPSTSSGKKLKLADPKDRRQLQLTSLFTRRSLGLQKENRAIVSGKASESVDSTVDMNNGHMDGVLQTVVIEDEKNVLPGMSESKASCPDSIDPVLRNHVGHCVNENDERAKMVSDHMQSCHKTNDVKQFGSDDLPIVVTSNGLDDRNKTWTYSGDKNVDQKIGIVPGLEGMLDIVGRKREDAVTARLSRGISLLSGEESITMDIQKQVSFFGYFLGLQNKV